MKQNYFVGLMMLICFETVTLQGMDPEISKQVEEEKERYAQEWAATRDQRQYVEYSIGNFHVLMDDPEDDGTAGRVISRHYERLADIVLNAGNRMCNKEKICLLIGDNWYQERKKIFKDMIEIDKVDPDTIIDNGDTILSEAVIHKDVDFAQYLLQHNASPDEILLSRLRTGWYKDNPAADLIILKFVCGVQCNDLPPSA